MNENEEINEEKPTNPKEPKPAERISAEIDADKNLIKAQSELDRIQDAYRRYSHGEGTL